jgi:hypothetical protein
MLIRIRIGMLSVGFFTSVLRMKKITHCTYIYCSEPPLGFEKVDGWARKDMSTGMMMGILTYIPRFWISGILERREYDTLQPYGCFSTVELHPSHLLFLHLQFFYTLHIHLQDLATNPNFHASLLRPLRPRNPWSHKHRSTCRSPLPHINETKLSKPHTVLALLT